MKLLLLWTTAVALLLLSEVAALSVDLASARSDQQNAGNNAPPPTPETNCIEPGCQPPVAPEQAVKKSAKPDLSRGQKDPPVGRGRQLTRGQKPPPRLRQEALVQEEAKEKEESQATAAEAGSRAASEKPSTPQPSSDVDHETGGEGKLARGDEEGIKLPSGTGADSMGGPSSSSSSSSSPSSVVAKKGVEEERDGEEGDQDAASVVAKKVEESDSNFAVAKSDLEKKNSVVAKKGVDETNSVVAKKGVIEDDGKKVVGKKGAGDDHEVKGDVQEGDHAKVVPKKGVIEDYRKKVVPKKGVEEEDEAVSQDDITVVGKKGVEEDATFKIPATPATTLRPRFDSHDAVPAFGIQHPEGDGAAYAAPHPPLTPPANAAQQPKPEIRKSPPVPTEAKRDPTPSTSLVVGAVFGMLLLSVLGFLLFKRMDAMKRRREYRRMNDFLIDGMYNDL